jgi:hypothetical protein
MYQTDTENRVSDEELIDVLTAISVVSKCLARKVAIRGWQSQSMEGRKSDACTNVCRRTVLQHQYMGVKK